MSNFLLPYLEALVGDCASTPQLGQISTSDSLRAIKPTADFLFYPIGLCSMRSRYTHLIPVPQNDGHFIQVPKAAQSSQAAKIALNPGTKLHEKLRPVPLTLLEAAKEIYATRGLFGFYEGLLTHLILSNLESSLAKQLNASLTQILSRRRERQSREYVLPSAGMVLGEASAGAVLASESDTSGLSLPKITVGPASGEDSESLSALARTRQALAKLRCRERYHCVKEWLSSEKCRETVITLASSAISSGIVYPLNTVAIRCDVYRPFDKQKMSFLQMSRCTIAYDGIAALYRGFGSHLVHQLITNATLLGRVAAIDIIPKDRAYARLMAVTLLKTLFTCQDPFLEVAEEERLTSNIPGLIDADLRWEDSAKSRAWCLRFLSRIFTSRK